MNVIAAIFNAAFIAFAGSLMYASDAFIHVNYLIT